MNTVPTWNLPELASLLQVINVSVPEVESRPQMESYMGDLFEGRSRQQGGILPALFEAFGDDAHILAKRLTEDKTE
jgi:hypothetical protein